MDMKRLGLLLIVLVISCGIAFADDNTAIEDNQIQTADDESDGNIDDSNGTEDSDNETYEDMDEDYETLINNNIGIQEDDFENNDVAEGSQSNATAMESNDKSPITQGVANATGNPILLLLLAMAIFGFNQIYKRD